MARSATSCGPNSSALHRWLGKPNPAVPQGNRSRSLAEVRSRWETVRSAERGAFVAGLTDARLDETRIVKPSSGGEYVHSFGQMFATSQPLVLPSRTNRDVPAPAGRHAAVKPLR